MRPRVSREMLFERQAPRCPHCDGLRMGEATVTLEQLIDSKIPQFVQTGVSGYANDTDGLVLVDCPDCGSPSVLARTSSEVKLVATRTDMDRAYEAAMGIIEWC